MRCGRGVVAVKMWDRVVWRGRYWTDWRLRRLCHTSVVSTHRSAATANWHGHDSYTIRCGEWSARPRHPRQVISIERLSYCYSHCYLYWYTSAAVDQSSCSGLVYAREHCRTSSPRFLAECRKRRLNQCVLLRFASLAFSELVLNLCIFCLFNLSSVLYFPALTSVNGAV